MASQTVLVVAAIIRKDGRFLIARRMDDGTPDSLKWEFPGGKVEPGENPKNALVREIKEELGIIIGNLEPFEKVSFVKEKSKTIKEKITIESYLADWLRGEIELSGCSDARLVGLDEFQKFDFLDADRKIIEELKKISPAI